VISLIDQTQVSARFFRVRLVGRLAVGKPKDQIFNFLNWYMQRFGDFLFCDPLSPKRR
jgi:hypothetical protein